MATELITPGTRLQQSTTVSRYKFVVSESTILPTVQTVKKSASGHPEAISLTPRETEVLALQGQGLSIKGIARELFIAPGTVKWHVKNVYEKLEASNREDALYKARLRQIIW